MSCAAGTANAKPFLDGDKCVSKCSNEQFVSVDDTMCVAECENRYIVVNSYGILHKKCKENWSCTPEGYEYDDPESKETICVSASVCKNHYKKYAYALIHKCLSVPPKDESEFSIYDGAYMC